MTTIKKIRLTTTLAKLRKHSPCASGWGTLLQSRAGEAAMKKLQRYYAHKEATHSWRSIV